MSIWSRLVNVFRGDRGGRGILEEIQDDACRDVRVVVWLDSLRADTVFAWRQIRKKKVTSAIAILSLAGLTFALIMIAQGIGPDALQLVLLQ